MYVCISIEDYLKVKMKVRASRSLALVCMCLHLALIAISTCIFFGLLEVCHHLCIKTKSVYNITSHLSF